jgi:hypothetical protein
MPDESTLILLNSFIISHTRTIRDHDVISDVDLAVLFEVDIETIRHLTATNLPKFKDDSVFVLTREEKTIHQHILFVFTDAGIFTLAGLIKSKRAIRIYVQLIELLVNRLQNRAYEIATSSQPNNS